MVFTKRQRLKILLLRAHVDVTTSDLKLSRLHVADKVKTLHKKRAVRATGLFFFVEPVKSMIFDVFTNLVPRSLAASEGSLQS